MASERPPPHSRRSSNPGHGHALVGYVTCHVHNRNAYHSRKDAKAVVRSMRQVYQDRRIEEYPCEHLDGKWHVGHPPKKGQS